MLNESQQKPKPRRAKYPQEKEDETNDVQIESEKGKRIKITYINSNDARKKTVPPAGLSSANQLGRMLRRCSTISVDPGRVSG